MATLACASGPRTVGPSAEEPIDGVDVVRAHYDVVLNGTVAPTCVVELEVVGPGAEVRSLSRPVSLVEGDGRGRWLPAGLDAADRALISVRTIDGVRIESWRAPRALPLAAVDPRSFARGASPGAASAGTGADTCASFVRFCEALLLARDPLGGDPIPGEIARAWFGAAVVARSGDRHPVVPTLADVCVELFAAQDAALARSLVDRGWHAPSQDAEWAVPRWLVLRDIVGHEAFREALRALYVEHAGAAAIGLEEVAASFENEDAQVYVRAWLGGPARPRVETSWRHDASRSRVLIRVDQVHEVGGGVAAAFPFTLPLVIVTEEGETLQRAVSVQRRRELVEVPCEGTPLAVRIDPEASLGSRVDLEASDGS